MADTYVLHNADSLLGLSDKLVLGLLNLLLGFIAHLWLFEVLWLTAGGLTREFEGVSLSVGLDGIQRKSRFLNILPRTGRKHNVGIECRVPAGKEAALDLSILSKTGFAHSLHGEGIFLETSSERVLAGAAVVLVEDLAAAQAGTGNGMTKGLGLGFRAGRGYEGGLGLLGRGGRGQKIDFFAHGTAEVLEGLLDIGWVIVGLG